MEGGFQRELPAEIAASSSHGKLTFPIMWRELQGNITACMKTLREVYRQTIHIPAGLGNTALKVILKG